MTNEWAPSDVYFGDPEAPPPDWRQEDEDDGDDTPTEEDLAALCGVLGFDPSELWQGGEEPKRKSFQGTPYVPFQYKGVGMFAQNKASHAVGVPFKGPSGRWFVVNPQGRTVPAKAPGSGQTGTPGGGGAAQTGPSQAPGPPPSTGSSPAMPAAGTPAHVLLLKLQTNQTMTAADIAALPAALSGLTRAELLKIKQALSAPVVGHTGTGKWSPQTLVTTLVAHASGVAGSPVPTPASPASGTPAPSATPTPAPSSVPPPTTLVPGTYWVPTGSGPGNTLTWDDKDAIDDVVEEWFKKKGLDPGQLLGYYDRNELDTELRSKAAPGSFNIHGWIDRSLASLTSQLATRLIAPIKLYSKGNKRGTNYRIDDHARPALKPAEKAGMAAYTGTAYRALNKSLREHGNPTPRTQTIHNTLQSIFRKTPPLQRPTTLYRRMQMDPAALSALVANAQACQAAGTSFKQLGYQSYSTRSNLGYNPLDNVVFETEATHGLDMKPYSHCPQADEVLLDHETDYDVVDVQQDSSGVWRFKLKQKTPAYAAGVTPTVAKPRKVPAGPAFAFLLGPGKGVPTAAPAVGTSAGPIPADITLSRAVQDALTGTKTHSWVTRQAGGYQDTFIEEVMKETGKADKPKVDISANVDALEAQGWKIFYRGGSKEYNDQMKTGDFYCGSGIYGNGTYTASVLSGSSSDKQNALQVARQYASSSIGVGGPDIMRIALPPTAKIVKVGVLRGKIKKYQTELDKLYNSKQIDYATYNSMHRITEDPGRFAALLNYDAIDGTGKGNKNYFVLLNRKDSVIDDDNYY